MARLFASFLPYRERKPKCISNSLKSMVAIASDGPSLLTPSLHLGLAAHKPSRRHHAQSLLGPSFHHPRTLHILGFHPERAAPLSRRDNARWHAIVSHSTLALQGAFRYKRWYLAACNTSSGCRFWVLDHFCSNLIQPGAIVIPFYSCWITETQWWWMLLSSLLEK